jgi:chromosome segregation ATPase
MANWTKRPALFFESSKLQEEVMEFEIKDLEIIDSNRETQPATFAAAAAANPNSIILNELHKETEELQAKLKLNYRRLLLFETENHKLMEEKNKLFFEAQDYMQKNQILTEKNEQLQQLNVQAENTQKLLIEKVESYETINRTQLNEIRRFSKFHTKIQEVVKPLVQKLKTQIVELKRDLQQAQKVNGNLTNAYNELRQRSEIEIKKRALEIENLTQEKSGIISTYEEQIHSFSKEILTLQAQTQDQEKEIARLKKAVEFKNYFENEVIRFKRIHEEDQKEIADLGQKKAALETRILGCEQQLLESNAELASLRTKSSDFEMNLDVTRSQLSKKIDELGSANERLARLEKLNNQLSLEMSLKQN